MGHAGPTAFVLAGGGSLGAVEVGMLKVLTAHGVRADFVVGSSVGALNAAFFAGRPSPEGVAELERVWRSLRTGDVFPFSPVQGFLGFIRWRDSLLDAGALRTVLERSLPYRRLEETTLPD